jgi:hypothetical protein
MCVEARLAPSVDMTYMGIQPLDTRATPMTEKRTMTTRARPVQFKVMLTEAERRELVRAAKKLDVPLSKYVRDAALEKARG